MFKSVLNSLNGADNNSVGNNKSKRNKAELAGSDLLSLNSSEGAMSTTTSSGKPAQISETAKSNNNKDKSYARLSIKGSKKRLSSMMSKLRVSSPSSTRRRHSGSKQSNNSNNNNNNESDDDYVQKVERDSNNDAELDEEDDDEDDAYKSATEEACRKSSIVSDEKRASKRSMKRILGRKSRKRKESSSSTAGAVPCDQVEDEQEEACADSGPPSVNLLPEEQCDIPTFLRTKNCNRQLIDETRRLLRERYAKSPDAIYDADYERMLTDDWTVTRFLLRRRQDPKRTAKLMEECGRFRKQYKMSEVQLWEFPIEFHQAGGLFMYAPDRVGNVTMYMRVRMYRRVPEISDVFKAFILCVLEQCDVANNGRGTAVIFDLSACGLQNVDLSFLSWLLSSFRNYCPKGVSYIIVYNLPWILNATCKLAMTWMSASNKRALRFVYGDEIENFIDRANLPNYLGGECKLNYRAIPAGSKPAIEVCDRLDITPEQALKIRELFKEYLTPDGGDDNGDDNNTDCSLAHEETKSNYADAKSAPSSPPSPTAPIAGHLPVADLVSQASRFISH